MSIFWPKRQTNDGPHPQIVIVDDEEDLCLLLKMVLNASGYEVATAHNGEDGLALIRHIRPLLTILDIQMPRMNGYQVLAHIQQDPELADMPVVIMTSLTSDSDKSDEAWAKHLGVKQFITKPMDPDVIVQVARRFVDEPGVSPP